MTATASKTSARAREIAHPNARPPERSLHVVKEPKLVSLIRELGVDPEMSDEDVAALVVARLKQMGAAAWPLITVAVLRSVSTDRRVAQRRSQGRIQRELQFTPGDGTEAAVSYVRKLSLDQLREFCGQSIPVPGLDAPKAGEDVTVEEWSSLRERLLTMAANASARADLYGSIMTTLRGLHADTIAEALKPRRRGAKGGRDGDR